MLTNTNRFETVTFRTMFLCYWHTRILTTFAHAQTNRRASHLRALGALVIFGTACQIYCYGRYCVTQSFSPKVPENPSRPLVDNFIILPSVACWVACVKLLPGVGRWNSIDKIDSSKRKLGCASTMLLLQRIASLNYIFVVVVEDEQVTEEANVVMRI